MDCHSSERNTFASTLAIQKQYKANCQRLYKEFLVTMRDYKRRENDLRKVITKFTQELEENETFSEAKDCISVICKTNSSEHFSFTKNNHSTREERPKTASCGKGTLFDNVRESKVRPHTVHVTKACSKQPENSKTKIPVVGEMDPDAMFSSTRKITINPSLFSAFTPGSIKAKLANKNGSFIVKVVDRATPQVVSEDTPLSLLERSNEKVALVRKETNYRSQTATADLKVKSKLGRTKRMKVSSIMENAHDRKTRHFRLVSEHKCEKTKQDVHKNVTFGRKVDSTDSSGKCFQNVKFNSERHSEHMPDKEDPTGRSSVFKNVCKTEQTGIESRDKLGAPENEQTRSRRGSKLRSSTRTITPPPKLNFKGSVGAAPHDMMLKQRAMEKREMIREIVEERKRKQIAEENGYDVTDDDKDFIIFLLANKKPEVDMSDFFNDDDDESVAESPIPPKITIREWRRQSANISSFTPNENHERKSSKLEFTDSRKGTPIRTPSPYTLHHLNTSRPITPLRRNSLDAGDGVKDWKQRSFSPSSSQNSNSNTRLLREASGHFTDAAIKLLQFRSDKGGIDLNPKYIIEIAKESDDVEVDNLQAWRRRFNQMGGSSKRTSFFQAASAVQSALNLL